MCFSIHPKLYHKVVINEQGKSVDQYARVEKIHGGQILHIVEVDLDEEFSPVLPDIIPSMKPCRVVKTIGGNYLIPDWQSLGQVSPARLKIMRAEYLLWRSILLTALQDNRIYHYPTRVVALELFFGGVDPTKEAVMAGDSIKTEKI